MLAWRRYYIVFMFRKNPTVENGKRSKHYFVILQILRNIWELIKKGIE
jgi:hypothetical protein